MPDSFTEADCLWNALSAETRPVVLYGTGNGGDKILDVCEARGIKISAVFASGGFVRNRTFRGFQVRSLEDVEKAFPEGFVILLAFGSARTDVAESIRAVARRHTLYIPEVPLYGGELFDFEYYSAHKTEIDASEKLFCDGESKQLYRDMTAFRMTGRPEYLERVQNPADSYREIIGSAKSIVDCGAYTGDSTAELAEALCPEKITAAEPDPRTFRKLSAYADSETRCKVTAVNAAVGQFRGTAEFALSGNRGSGSDGKSRRSRFAAVDVVPIDELCTEHIDLIKLDVEGAESAALDGAAEVIRRDKPSLAVSVYHRTEDIFKLSEKVHAMLPEHKLYLRRAPCIPAWDIVLFAKKHTKSE